MGGSNMFTVENIIVFLVVGIIAGWLAGLIWKKRGFGLLGNLVVGIIGAFIGSYVFGLLKISFHGIIGLIIAAVVGALILLFIISLLFKKR